MNFHILVPNPPPKKKKKNSIHTVFPKNIGFRKLALSYHHAEVCKVINGDLHKRRQLGVMCQTPG